VPHSSHLFHRRPTLAAAAHLVLQSIAPATAATPLHRTGAPENPRKSITVAPGNSPSSLPRNPGPTSPELCPVRSTVSPCSAAIRRLQWSLDLPDPGYGFAATPCIDPCHPRSRRRPAALSSANAAPSPPPVEVAGPLRCKSDRLDPSVSCTPTPSCFWAISRSQGAP
jgi:hypothetical protein